MQVIALIGEDGEPVCESCEVAERLHDRLRARLRRRPPAAGEGILLRPCSSIRTWFLRVPIDAVFLDPDLRVLDAVSGVRPHAAASRKHAHAVLELAAGVVDRLRVAPGDRLAWGATARV